MKQGENRSLCEGVKETDQYARAGRAREETGSTSAFQPRTGHWIMKYHNARKTIGHIECSVCGSITYKQKTYKFCPECGAKMSGLV